MAKHNQYTGFSKRVESRRQSKRKLINRMLFIFAILMAVLIWTYVEYIGA